MDAPTARTLIRRLAFLILALGLMAGTTGRMSAAPTNPPNFLVILADDLGYSDIGCYGGEIATPNLDRLAAGGLRFTQFYNTGRCWPSRSALMTGHYPQQIRMDPPSGPLPTWARLLPHHLKPRGYRSYHSGKWHVMGAPKVVAQGGFDRSYLIHDTDRNFTPRSHAEDDRPLPPVPQGTDYYTSTEYANRLIGYLRQHSKEHAGKPFLAYLAFTAPHFPLHAPAEDIARIADRYSVGWDRIREQRARRIHDLGLVRTPPAPPEALVVPHWNMKAAELRQQISPDELADGPAWDTLTASQQRFQSVKMAIHAAMVERMDREIGRVVDELRRMGTFDNTVILFASDNGASAELLNRGDKHHPEAPPGSSNSFLCLGPGWSTAANTPFRLHKSWVHEGGIATPLIVHWPAAISSGGALRHTPAHLIDVVPTLLELAGATSVLPTNAPPFSGRSLVPALAADVPVPRDSLYFHHEHNRALRIGDWKAVTRRPATNEWALYHVGRDRGEQQDLSATEPERVRTMAAEWERLTALHAAQSK